ncbi:MAG: HEPN domain-containing protein [Oscillospiraceae bacterium]|jgi:HEPN domain-containing protein|nr:HEPN domain-containing protein [Oscillospiraceae bacterium]
MESGDIMQSKVDYWIDLCDDDIVTARALLNSKRLLHMGFFCHMVVEKALKAVVASVTGEIPPKIHDLPKLAVRGGVWDDITDAQKELMKNLIPLQIETRYPEYKAQVAGTLTVGYCKELLSETEDFLCWIKQRLGI